jgi:prepilin-type N-terminal cleavage/methylation domain-containing protein
VTQHAFKKKAAPENYLSLIYIQEHNKVQTKNRQQGFSLIELLIVVAIIGIIAAIAIPNLMATRRAANEASAISAVRTVSSAEATYRHTIGQGTTYADFSGLLSQDMIDSTLANATTPDKAKSGYVYAITLPADKENFVVGTAPVNTNAGSRRFSSDMPGVIYVDLTDVTTVPTTVTGSPATN